jgi:TP901 family phage tail tape measure protein
MGSLDKTAAKAGAQLQSIGSKLTTGLTLPLVAVGGMAVKAAIDFEKSFSGVGKTVDGVMSKGGKLTAFGEQLQQGFRDMAKTMPVSVNELNKIGEAAGSLGIQGKDILSFTQTMAMLGATTNLTSDEAATGIAQIQNQYQAAGVDTDKFASSLVALGNAGASTEKQILDFAARMGGAANQMGISQAEVLGWSNAMASVGINAELGSTAWNKVVSQMGVAADLGGEKIKGFAKVAGMSTMDFTALVKSDASEALNKVVAGFGRVKAEGGNLTQTMIDLGMKNSGVQMTFKNLAGASGMVSDSLKLGKSAWIENTAAAEEYGKKAGTTASQLQMLYNKAYDAAISLGQQLVPAMMKLIPTAESVLGFVVKLIDGFSNLPSGVQAAVIGIAAFAAALGPIAYLGGTAIQTISGLAAGAKIASGSLSTMMAGGLSAAPLVAQLGLIGAALAALSFGAYKVYGAITNIMDAKAKGGWAAVLGELGRNVNNDDLSLFKSGRLDQQPGSSGKGHDVNLRADPVAASVANVGAGSPEATAVVEQSKKELAAAKRAAEAYQKELDKLSGREAITVAGEWMQKVSAIGGVTKLATADQKAYNDALGDAIQAMGRLGKAADPKIMAEWLKSFQGPGVTSGIKVTGVNKDGTFDGLPGSEVDKPVAPMVPVPRLNFSNGLPGLPGAQMGLPDVSAQVALTTGFVNVLRNNLGTLSEAFYQVGQSANNAFGQAMMGISGVFNSLQTASKAGGLGIATALFDDKANSSARWASGIQSAMTIASGAMNVWNSTANDGTKAAGAFHGAMGGAQAGAMFGPWGMAIGAAGGALMGFIHTLSAGRREVESFAESFNTAAKGSGFDELHAKLLTLGQAGEDLWIKLTQKTKKGDKSAAQAVEEEIRSALENAPVSMETQAGNAGYHTSAELQATAAQAKALYDYMASSGMYSAAQVQQAWEAANTALIASGDQTAIAAQQTNQAITDLDTKIKGLQESYANEAPEEVMGVIEANARAQVDALQAQKDAAVANIEAIKAALQPLIDGGVTIPVNFDVKNMPKNWGDYHHGQDEQPEPGPDPVPLATGGIVRARPGGLLARIGEGGQDEAVVPLGRGGRGGAGGSTIVIEMDGRSVAEFVVPHIPGVVQRFGLA